MAKDIAPVHKPTNILLLVALAVTAVITPIHGDSGSAADIAERGEWQTIHVIQVFSYSLIGVGALAYAVTSGRSQNLRLAMMLAAVGALYTAIGHVVDGPMRVAMLDAGLADGDALYDVLIDGAVWLIVPGYAFMGVGGAMYAWNIKRNTTGAASVTAVVAMVLYVVGGAAGTAELGLIPGISFLALTVAWLWTAVTLGSEMRRRENAAARVVSTA